MFDNELLKQINKDYRFPMIQRKYYFKIDDIEEPVKFYYPGDIFLNLKRKHKIYFHDSKYNETIKQVLDLYMSNQIDTPAYHFALYCVVGEKWDYLHEKQFSESKLGKRRFAHFQSSPQYKIISNDEFFADVWSSLILRNEHHDEWTRNPYMDRVRILFEGNLFSDYTGRGYYSDGGIVDWVEPISGGSDMKSKTWSSEKDPMTKIEDDSYIEGKIIIGMEAGGLRHFVDGVSINAGRYMEAKFGDGWIKGGYEWSFEKDAPIRLCSGMSTIHIKEGHLVRIKK